jgi:hypothetical protein
MMAATATVTDMVHSHEPPSPSSRPSIQQPAIPIATATLTGAAAVALVAVLDSSSSNSPNCTHTHTPVAALGHQPEALPWLPHGLQAQFSTAHRLGPTPTETALAAQLHQLHRLAKHCTDACAHTHTHVAAPKAPTRGRTLVATAAVSKRQSCCAHSAPRLRAHGLGKPRHPCCNTRNPDWVLLLDISPPPLLLPL